MWQIAVGMCVLGANKKDTKYQPFTTGCTHARRTEPYYSNRPRFQPERLSYPGMDIWRSIPLCRGAHDVEKKSEGAPLFPVSYSDRGL